MPNVSLAKTAQLPATDRGRRSRAAIIDAAATIMYQRGVSAASLDDVLAAAGCGKSQLYHYFTDRSELVQAVIDRQLELILANQPALNKVDSWAGLRRWADQILDKHRVPGGPFACPLGSMAAELKNDEAYLPALDAAFDRWESALAAGLEKMRERGQLRKSADPHRLAAALLAALQGGMLSARVHNDITPLEDAVDNALLALRHKAAAPRIVKR
ncbi:TetR family transcriptional regulator [Mycobacterium persicum]|nr:MULTISPECIES: TetR/AcrR family transcriptional regulator [Mycobacterium]APA77179.2 TetR/AcrR family transcriptional regulator [Mycobacterium avium subsp. hominissuis]KZS85416.1 TetR family transcriptional regulator [Mycobacterium persicum]MCQ4363509.1 TetR/AcrR family transcriptional regulator [Mycobacterium gordonae]MDP7736210.1 TetR/AcrR family transcriptional regulator [Mycobacterium paragordonae]MXO35392.1 TetR/AcrR family transcriptional regulator [Mycobacterium kansasii]